MYLAIFLSRHFFYLVLSSFAICLSRYVDKNFHNVPSNMYQRRNAAKIYIF